MEKAKKPSKTTKESLGPLGPEFTKGFVNDSQIVDKGSEFETGTENRNNCWTENIKPRFLKFYKIYRSKRMNRILRICQGISHF